MNMDVLKLEKNRGYVIAGIAGIIAILAFFLPYVTVSFLGVSESISGTSLSWVWFEEIAALVVTASAAILIFRNNAFGLTNMPLEKQIKYGRYAIIGGGAFALVIHVLFALVFHGAYGDLSGYAGVGLGFGFWVFLLAGIGMIVGGVLAQRSPIPAMVAGAMPTGQPWQQPYQQQTQYPPQQPYQQQSGYPAQQQPYQQQPGYPPQQPMPTPYPGQQQAYPPQQPGYPPQQPYQQPPQSPQSPQPPQQDATQLYQPPQNPQPPSQW